MEVSDEGGKVFGEPEVHYMSASSDEYEAISRKLDMVLQALGISYEEETHEDEAH